MRDVDLGFYIYIYICSGISDNISGIGYNRLGSVIRTCAYQNPFAYFTISVWILVRIFRVSSDWVRVSDKMSKPTAYCNITILTYLVKETEMII